MFGFSLSLVAKLCILRWALTGMDMVLDPASIVHSRNCSFWYLRVGFSSALGLLGLYILTEKAFLLRAAHCTHRPRSV